jgi:MFS family permease
MVIAPALGVVLDKVGACVTMIIGTLATSAGILLVSISREWVPMLAGFTLAGIGFSASFLLPSAVVVAEWMPERKNLGMGIIIGSMSVGAAALAPAIGWCSGKYGWGPSLQGVAAVIMLLAPLVWLTLRTPPIATSAVGDGRAKMNLRGAARDLLSTVYILTASGSIFAFLGLGCVQFHVISVLLNAGYTSDFANLAFGGTWLLSALGAYLLGAIADRWGTVRTLAAVLATGALGTLALLYAGDKHIGIACVTMFVVLWGASANCVSQLTPVILVEQFGSEHLGTLIGVEFGISGIVGALAPLTTGLIFDKFGDYRFAIGLSAVATSIASVLIISINAQLNVGLDDVSQK